MSKYNYKIEQTQGSNMVKVHRIDSENSKNNKFYYLSLSNVFRFVENHFENLPKHSLKAKLKDSEISV